jgi:hypothetical protein
MLAGLGGPGSLSLLERSIRMWKSTRSILRNRVFKLIGAMAIVGLVLAAKPPVAHACPSSTVEIYYYTDATYSTQCGYKIITCYCASYHEGCVTSFSVVENSPC